MNTRINIMAACSTYDSKIVSPLILIYVYIYVYPLTSSYLSELSTSSSSVTIILNIVDITITFY